MEANRLRVPWKSASEPYGLAWRKYSSPTKRYLGAECFQTLNAPEQSTGSIVLNERNGTISTREFEVSNSLKAVEIEFYLQEYGSQSGKLSLLLGNETLDFQSFDPNLAEPEWSGLIDNVEGTIEVLSETRNHVKLVVPSTWIERDKLFFGVQVSEGLSVKVYTASECGHSINLHIIQQENCSASMGPRTNGPIENRGPYGCESIHCPR